MARASGMARMSPSLAQLMQPRRFWTRGYTSSAKKTSPQPCKADRQRDLVRRQIQPALHTGAWICGGDAARKIATCSAQVPGVSTSAETFSWALHSPQLTQSQTK